MQLLIIRSVAKGVVTPPAGESHDDRRVEVVNVNWT